MTSEQINIKLRPDFMTPKPVSPKRLRKESILGKRKYGHSFATESYEEERYGQQIDNQFFQNNVGHNVVQEAAAGAIDDFRAMLDALFPAGKQPPESLGASDIIEWCEFYLKNKNLFNV
jgi:hypothetical protein